MIDTPNFVPSSTFHDILTLLNSLTGSTEGSTGSRKRIKARQSKVNLA